MDYHRYVAIIFFCMIAVTLTACGKTAESGDHACDTFQSIQTEGTVELENPFGETQEPVREPAEPENLWAYTCWQAVRYMMTVEGQTLEGTLPEDDRVIELYLLEGGVARYREWKPQSFDYTGAYHLLLGIGPDCFWYLDGSGRFFLSTEADGINEDAVFAQGHMAESQLMLDFLGDQFWLEWQPMPAKGGEYCMADLFGQWRMVSGETVTEGDPEVWDFTASEMEICRRLTFRSSWDETEPDGVDYYDEWHPGYLREAQAMTVEYQETPIYEGCGNEAWRLQLFSAETIYQNYAEEEFYVTVLDADTLLFQMRLKDTNGIRTTSTQVFNREIQITDQEIW